MTDETIRQLGEEPEAPNLLTLRNWCVETRRVAELEGKSELVAIMTDLLAMLDVEMKRLEAWKGWQEAAYEELSSDLVDCLQLLHGQQPTKRIIH